MTKVAFKIEVNPSTKGREVFAFFPDDHHYGDFYTSYSHVGQHSLCEKPYFDRRKWANFHEYEALYRELVRIGYDDLEVLNKDWSKFNCSTAKDL